MKKGKILAIRGMNVGMENSDLSFGEDCVVKFENSLRLDVFNHSLIWMDIVKLILY